ncbi:MAG: hypothetical protein IRZ32_16925 [Solirubrobacteraceae bacterium]|nr:hypothetical protein [Solirubrobacteraceae bacterium]
MEPVSFAHAELQVVPVAGGDDEVVLATNLTAADARALVEALSWQRARDHLVPAIETAEHVLALRELTALVDLLEVVADDPHGGPVVLNGPRLRLLAEAACRYAHERDGEGYVTGEVRDRVERLRNLTGPLFEWAARVAQADRRELARRW